ncbi:unknown similar to AcMNPV orf105 [Mythimna separata entomopoxvirus 'L']|uniref:Uncharacterized protein n=1 Tax=Mythimna separata entomopoxvirus 'L' TaxID=1293572 RepID=A0A916KQJ1_9POXV|nr:unknown similar to AcMNPV orf105 [Mythimna separata entomopoxvirus 'L']CCU56479.1 unknown similar to AcMNPV orf105 [Mythimna separata entomopoxvirus 'L']
MELIRINHGSSAKGYNLEDSDTDIIEFSKCSKKKFYDHITKLKNNQEKIINSVKKTPEGDLVKSDIFTGLTGIYYGDYYYLAVFGNKNNIKDESLYNFIKKLGKIRMPIILKTMSKIDSEPKKKKQQPKNLLMILFNLAYIDYWIKYNEYPECIKMPGILNNDKKNLYDRLIKKKNKEDVDDDDIKEIDKYRNYIISIIDQFPFPEDRYDILDSIIDYMRHDKELFIYE